MNHSDIKDMAAAIVPTMKEFVKASVDPLSARLSEVEARAPIPGPAGADGVPGAPGERGADGADGKHFDPDLLFRAVDDAVARLPVPANGKDGRDGIDGKDGRDGAEVAPEVVAKAVEDAFSRVPMPIDGKDGMPGEAGPEGPMGPQGPCGEMGPPGTQGEPGPCGMDGKDGADGASGRDGECGPMGPPGPQGEPGPPGSAGSNGKDVDPSALKALHDLIDEFRAELRTANAEIERLKSLPVAPSSFLIVDGDLTGAYQDGSTKNFGRVRGEDGKRGASMMDLSSDNGTVTVRMSDGRNIVMRGNILGPPGAAGQNGADGRNGLDAAALVIRPSIDLSRSYGPGVTACHAGGVIQATRTTDPVKGDDILAAGWCVLSNGIHTEDEKSLDDGRIIERTTTYTDGRSVTRRVKTSIPVYRGVWRDGTFERGDMATHEGSQWHCARETKDRPGTSADWVLAVKRGRDAKEPVKLNPPSGPVKL